MYVTLRPIALAATVVAVAWEGTEPVRLDTLADWKTELAYRTDGWWETSNAEYLDQDNGIVTYGLRLRLTPGGMAATGCLWGVRGERTLGPFWYFSSGWDPARGAPFAYQSSPSGAAGFGYHRVEPDGPSAIEQVFSWPDGTRESVRHESRFAPPDTMVDRSFARVDGALVPRRTYRWVRRHGGDTPC